MESNMKITAQNIKNNKASTKKAPVDKLIEDEHFILTVLLICK